MRTKVYFTTVLILLLNQAGSFAGEDAILPTKSISDLSIEDLLNIKITSVSKKVERANTAPAAIHVITQDDMRRAGVNSIAEALRLAPGMNVAKMDSRQWAISARGFQEQFSNKLLVLVDGRSVYSASFSGAFWDIQDTVMEDIDRIEVIRGPGAALWGANAVNGVINIITKSARDTQGGLVTAGVGTEEHGTGAVRYGFKVGNDAHLRVFGKFDNHADSALPGGENPFDAWRQARGGARFDWKPSSQDTVTIQGEGYHAAAKQSYTIPSLTPSFERLVNSEDDIAGGNVLGRWTHSLSDRSEFTLQAYYDRERRKLPVYSVFQDTVDIDFQWRLPAGERHEIVWGAGYRAVFDNYDPRFVVTIRPGKRYSPLFSAFIQDDITIIDDKLHFIFGSKFEHNSFTGFEVQPNARLLWTPKPNHTVWGGVSRAVRTPSRGEDGLELNARALPPGALGAGAPAALARITGNKDYKSEELCAFELGYRSNPLRSFSFDIATFYNLYNDLRTGELQAPVPEATPGPPHLLLEQRIGNNMHGYSFGGELVATYQPYSWWRLSAQYSYLKMHFDLDGNSNDFDSQRDDRGSPEHTVSLRSNFELPHNVEVGAGIRYVSDIAYDGTPAYLVGDATVIWHATKNLSLSLTGQNLFDDRHPESSPSFVRTPQSEVEHSVFFKLTFKF